MKKHYSARQLTQFSLLLALEIILGVTPLGLIMIPPVAITLMHIPVIIGAIVMGPGAGMLLGGTFGIISMVKATTSALSPLDIMFSPFLSGKPLASIFICVVCRVLLGLCAGLLFRALNPLFKNNLWSIGISAVGATLVHTVMVLGSLWLFFGPALQQALGTSAGGIGIVLGTIFSLNGGLEMLAAAVIAVPVCKALLKYNKTTA